MSCYPTAQKMIERGDNSVLHIHRSFRSSIWLILTAAIGVGVVAYVIRGYGSDLRWIALVPGGLVLEIARRYLDDLYIVSRDAIVHRQGRVSLRYAVPSIRCVDLRAISVEQTLFGRILNFGGVSLSTAAQSGAEITMSGVASPRELSQLIDDLRLLSQRASKEDLSGGGASSGRIGND